MKFEEKFTVRDYEVNPNGNMLPCYLSYYMQETAERCITAEKFGTVDMHLVEHKAYIISKLAIEVYDKMPRFSELTVRTWVSEGHGAIYPRYHEFVGEDGSILAKATGDWAIVDTDTKKLVRCGDYDLGNVSYDEPLTIGLAGRVRLPQGYEYNYADTFRVGLSQTDINRHMNNVAYLNPMYDNIPNAGSMNLCSFNIHFKHECLEGDRIEVWVSDPIVKINDSELAKSIDARADIIFYVKLVKDGSIKAEAAWGFKK